MRFSLFTLGALITGIAWIGTETATANLAALRGGYRPADAHAYALA